MGLTAFEKHKPKPDLPGARTVSRPLALAALETMFCSAKRRSDDARTMEERTFIKLLVPALLLSIAPLIVVIVLQWFYPNLFMIEISAQGDR